MRRRDRHHRIDFALLAVDDDGAELTEVTVRVGAEPHMFGMAQTEARRHQLRAIPMVMNIADIKRLIAVGLPLLDAAHIRKRNTGFPRIRNAAEENPYGGNDGQ